VINKGFNQHNGMPMTGLPVSAQTLQIQGKRTEGQIGYVTIGKNQETNIIGNQVEPFKLQMLIKGFTG
jgi:hypothetical protein